MEFTTEQLKLIKQICDEECVKGMNVLVNISQLHIMPDMKDPVTKRVDILISILNLIKEMRPDL